MIIGHNYADLNKLTWIKWLGGRHRRLSSSHRCFSIVAGSLFWCRLTIRAHLTVVS